MQGEKFCRIIFSRFGVSDRKIVGGEKKEIKEKKNTTPKQYVSLYIANHNNDTYFHWRHQSNANKFALIAEAPAM